MRTTGGSSGGTLLDARLYATLAAAGTAVLRSTSRHQLYVTLARALTEQGDFDVACVAVRDDDTEDGFRVVADGAASAAAGLDPRSVGSTAGRALIRSVLLDGQAGTVSGPRSSTCAMALQCGPDVVAVLFTSLFEPRIYDAQRTHLLERLSDEASFTLKSIADRESEVDSRLARSAVQVQLAARAEMHAELARIGQMALSADSLDGLFVEIVDAAWRILNLDLAVVEERFPDGRLGVCAGSGVDDWRPASRILHADDRSFSSHVLRADGPVVVGDLNGTDGVHVAVAPKVRAAAGVVIRPRDEVFGVLVVGSEVPRQFAADEVDFLQSLANVAAAALEHQHASLRLVEQALHDPLTGLPNRVLLFDRLEEATTALRPGRLLAVLLVDLDGFKLINDALGHDVGDQLLVAVAGRLRAIVRDGDVVARLGGDEFAVLCVDLPDRDAAAELAERLGEAMATPFDLEAVQTFVTASIGITLHEGPADSPRALLREADAAMYAAKESGRARYEVFDDTMRRRAVRRLEMTNDLRRALEREQLELVWHPILTLGLTAGDQAPVSLEALLRWRHPDRGIVVPDDFIGLAEDTGLIRPIGEWALVAVAQQLARWRRDDPAGCPDLVSVNLSAHQLARPCIVDTVLSAFTDAGIEPTAVELEITETAFMGDPIHAIARLRELRRLGFVIAIDDFGTGYSSMSYLRDLPASALKVDRSFVARLGHDVSDHSIVEAIIGLAHAVGLQAVAEGVETAGQLRALEAMGCDRAQGFLWTRPLDPVDVPGWIERQRADQRQGSPVSSADPVRLCP